MLASMPLPCRRRRCRGLAISDELGLLLPWLQPAHAGPRGAAILGACCFLLMQPACCRRSDERLLISAALPVLRCPAGTASRSRSASATPAARGESAVLVANVLWAQPSSAVAPHHCRRAGAPDLGHPPPRPPGPTAADVDCSPTGSPLLQHGPQVPAQPALRQEAHARQEVSRSGVRSQGAASSPKPACPAASDGPLCVNAPLKRHAGCPMRHPATKGKQKGRGCQLKRERTWHGGAVQACGWRAGSLATGQLDVYRVVL